MRNHRKTEIKVGITVIVAIIVFIWILTWAKNYSLHANENTLEVQFENVSGLEKGDPITVNGVRKGFVDDISVDGNKALVKIMIDSDVKIKKDAQFSIIMFDLMGGKKIEVKPGESKEDIDYHSIQKGTFYADIPQVMAMLGSVQNDLINIIKDVQVTLTSINKILTDNEFNDQMKTSLANLTEISAKLNSLIDENRKNVNTLIKNSAQLSGEAADFIHDNREQVKNSINEVENLIKNTNDLIAKINRFSEETTNKKNNIGKLLYDEKIMDDLQATLKQARELTNMLNEQLKGKGINIDANVDLF